MTAPHRVQASTHRGVERGLGDDPNRLCGDYIGDLSDGHLSDGELSDHEGRPGG